MTTPILPPPPVVPPAEHDPVAYLRAEWAWAQECIAVLDAHQTAEQYDDTIPADVKADHLVQMNELRAYQVGLAHRLAALG